jgi:hypothetical protein
MSNNHQEEILFGKPVEGVTSGIDDDALFDPANLRLDQNFQDRIGVRKARITVPTRKPGRQEFFRVHPSAEYRLQTAIIEDQENRDEGYLVAANLWSEVPTGVLVPRLLLTAVTRQNVVFLWPVRLPGADGRLDAWSQSAMEVANLATKGWLRMAANQGLGAYEPFLAAADLSAPEWPTESFTELLNIAFKGRRIKDLNHPILQRLRGEV